MIIVLDEEDLVSHVLYRFLDRGGRLLYVGITKDPAARFRRHGRDQYWWDEVSSIHLQRFGSRPQLMAAERYAIENERPMYNKQLNYSDGEHGGEFDVVKCPVCGVDSFYRFTMGRYYHLWGTDNRPCWVALTSGSFENPDDRMIDRHGHPIPDEILDIW